MSRIVLNPALWLAALLCASVFSAIGTTAGMRGFPYFGLYTGISDIYA